MAWDVIEVPAVQFLTPIRNDNFQQSKKSTSVTGPRKHFRTGYMKVGFMSSMGDAVTVAAAAGREGGGGGI